MNLDSFTNPETFKALATKAAGIALLVWIALGWREKKQTRKRNELAHTGEGASPADEAVGHIDQDGRVYIYEDAPRAVLLYSVGRTSDEVRASAIREAMTAIAETESIKQALEIMEGMLKP